MKRGLGILCGFVLALLAASAIQAAAAPSRSYVRNAFEEQIDALIREGYEQPAQALAVLEQMRDRAKTPDERRQRLQAIGSIEAQAGNAAKAGAVAEQLLALSRDDPSGRALAASNLVRALMAENAGQPGVAAALAQSALPVFEAGCPSPAPTTLTTPAAPAAGGLACDYRSAWRTLLILQRRATSLGVPASEAAHAQAALVLAEWGGDARKQAINLGALALLAQGRGEPESAQHLISRARRLAAQTNDPAAQALVSDADAQIAGLRDERGLALQYHEQARALAAQANAPRLEARMLTNLSDVYVRLGRPADALSAAERAMLIVRRHKDLRAERLLINNAGIAKIGLGRIVEGKQDLARLLELWQQSGETGRQAQTLLEFGDALAAAGDARSAIDLFHRERALSAELMRTNRSIALRELQTRNDAEARQRDIDLLGRDNALKTEALANRELDQRIWWLLAALMLLATAVVALLYWRVRETNRRLAASHVQLQAQSERDPLTHLANRRHFQAVMARLTDGRGFEGALLLVDIDHFKRVNDVQGHAAGDQVLVEVARRLNEAVRSDDLVVRWGGEEFLILAPHASAEQAEQISERVLHALGQTPIVFGARPVHITASIGYARFPLPPHSAAVPWEQAVNFADMALYTAKNQGRNRAVGITSATASTHESLRAIEADFDRAWHDGRVTLAQTAGPEAGSERAAEAQAA